MVIEDVDGHLVLVAARIGGRYWMYLAEGTFSPPPRRTWCAGAMLAARAFDLKLGLTLTARRLKPDGEQLRSGFRAAR